MRGVVALAPLRDAEVNHSVSSTSQPAGFNAPEFGAVLVPVVAVATAGAVLVSKPLIKYVVCADISTLVIVAVIVAPVEG